MGSRYLDACTFRLAYEDQDVFSSKYSFVLVTTEIPESHHPTDQYESFIKAG